MEDYSDYFELRKIHDDSYELTLLNIWNKQILTSNIKKLEKLSNKRIISIRYYTVFREGMWHTIVRSDGVMKQSSDHKSYPT